MNNSYLKMKWHLIQSFFPKSAGMALELMPQLSVFTVGILNPSKMVGQKIEALGKEQEQGLVSWAGLAELPREQRAWGSCESHSTERGSPGRGSEAPLPVWSLGRKVPPLTLSNRTGGWSRAQPRLMEKVKPPEQMLYQNEVAFKHKLAAQELLAPERLWLPHP